MTHQANPTATANYTFPGRALALALALGLTLGAIPAAATGISKHIACNFTSGTATTFEGGKFSTSAPKPLAFEISRINLEDQSANLVGNDRQVPGRLKIVRAINANHFIEVVNEGYLNLTTVYDADPKSGKFPAVHSRHLGILGQPIFAQYTGLCTPKN